MVLILVELTKTFASDEALFMVLDLNHQVELKKLNKPIKYYSRNLMQVDVAKHI